jgi:hypothetical protein
MNFFSSGAVFFYLFHFFTYFTLALFFVIFIYFDETDLKQPEIQRKINTSLWIFKILRKEIREAKVSRLLPNVCDFQKENHTLGYGFKNL